MTKVSKYFPGTKALEAVDFSLNRGEIHALMGENGAGKSTLIKTLTGVYRRDSGQIRFEKQEIDLKAPHEAPRIGISTVYQEVNLIPTLSVAENIFLGRQPGRSGKVDWKAMHQGAQKALARLMLKLDVKQLLSAYPIAVQQMVAIARAVDISARVLILDEPTSSLDAQETSRLFSVIRRLKAEGMGIVFVTHFLDQVYELTDRITVLRNGKLVGVYPTAALPRLELIAKMMGKEFSGFKSAPREQVNGTETAAAAGTKRKTTFLKATRLGRKGVINPFNLEIKAGEIVGLAGLLGSGRTELAQVLFGVHKPESGQYEINGRRQTVSNPRRAIELGLGFCPEDRKTHGIVAELTIRENIILALQAKKGWLRFISRKKQEELADHYIKALNIVTPSREQKIKNLSGGNQQKVILARWLAANPQLLILDEPTRGIDIGAKTEILKYVTSLSEQGLSILFISAELSEIVRCASRLAVLRDRKLIKELTGADIDESKIMQTIAQGNTHA
jgi:simple sugar transport system ATP-binding protein